MSKSRLAAVLAAAVLPLAGCGDSGSGGDPGADPAKVVPASAPAYVEAVVRPDGDVRDGVRDALKKLLHNDDPDRLVVGLVDHLARGANVDWGEIKQWLGPRVGVYLGDLSDAHPVVAVVADATNKDKAKATLDKVAKQAGSDEAATAIVGDYAVFATPEGLKAVQQTSAGGKSLADDADYRATRGAVSADDGLGVAYVEPQGLLSALAKAEAANGAMPAADRQALDVIRQVAARAGRAAAVSLHADGDAIRAEGAAIGASATGSPTAAADALAALPADAWLGIGAGDLGKSLTDALTQIGQLTGLAGITGGIDVPKLLERFERRNGIDIRKDLLSWMGDGAVYARGHSFADIGGVVTIESTNPAKSRKAVGLVAQALARQGLNARSARIKGYDVAIELRSPLLPISFFIAANGERFSIGVNPQAMSDVLDPSKKLGDSDAYDKARELLGGDTRPLAIVDTPTIIALLESFGINQQPGYDRVKPYLDALGPISVGTSRDGDLSRFSFALALR